MNKDRYDYDYDPEEEYEFNGTLPSQGVATSRYAESRRGFVEEFEELLDKALAKEESNDLFLNAVVGVEQESLEDYLSQVGTDNG
jgi:hypothetical protein